MRNPFLEFRLTGFRCFKDMVAFEDAAKVNVISGANNSGKSSLMLALRRLTTWQNPLERPYYGAGQWAGDRLSELRFDFRDINVACDEFIIEFTRLTSQSFMQEAFGRDAYSDASLKGKRTPPRHLSVEFVGNRNTFSDDLMHYSRGIQYIPAKRAVSRILHKQEAKRNEENLFDGDTVLPWLLGLSNPSYTRWGNPEGSVRYIEAVEAEMTRFLDTPVRLLPVPTERDIEVRLGDGVYSIRQLGEGIEQLLILSAALVQYPSDLLLVEEPELFLHPTIQRKVLLRFLERDGESVLVTHSNHLLDIRDEKLAYYRTFISGPGSSNLERINSYRKYDAIWDLGARPSSLFESNATIWVEGPSDAIYIRAWLALMPEAAGLIEGIHYSFAFHSGALLSKFVVQFYEPITGESPDEIVDFCSIHPNFYIVADRDSSSQEEVGHAYLERVQRAVNPDRLWVTQGKETENYLPLSLLAKYLTNRASPRYDNPKLNNVQIEDVLYEPFWRIVNLITGTGHYSKYPNKVNFASAVTELLRNDAELQRDVLSTLDLRDHLIRLIDFIRAKSDIDPNKSGIPMNENA